MGLGRVTRTPAASVVAGGYKTGTAQAALANGVMAHALLYDDTTFVTVAHHTVVLAPALLALGEPRGASGRALLEAYVIGYEVLNASSSPLLKTAAEIAHTHHEKFDGSGYPRGLKGSDIPLFGRIVAVADVFDALTSERPYKKAWSVEDAAQLLREGSGKHFDPDCVEAFFKVFDEVREIKAEYLDQEFEIRDRSLG